MGRQSTPVLPPCKKPQSHSTKHIEMASGPQTQPAPAQSLQNYTFPHDRLRLRQTNADKTSYKNWSAVSASWHCIDWRAKTHHKRTDGLGCFRMTVMGLTNAS